jgi:hypothetical protein
MRSALAFPIALALALASPVACTGTQVSGTTEIEEPIRLESGQFIPGDLPGVATGDASTEADGGLDPQVIDIGVSSTAIAQGERGLAFSGHATADAQSVAVRFADLGSGYWVVPVGGTDPQDKDLPTWSFTADFGRDLPIGNHKLVFSALSPSGASGTQNGLTVCIDTPVPDNLSACSPRRVPPGAVLSLSWDAPVDLDLTVRTPSGAVISGVRAAPPAVADGGSTTTAAAVPTDGVVDRESNRNCVIDDIDRQNVVWTSPPPSGTYEVWVALVNACRQGSVTFRVALWIPEAIDGGRKVLVEQPALASGVLTAQQANGGANPGLFVGSFQFR